MSTAFFRLGIQGLCMCTLHAAPLTGPWFTGSNSGIPFLSATNASSFTWGSAPGETDTARTGALWQNFTDLTVTGEYQFIRFSFAFNPFQIPATNGNGLRFGLFNHQGSLLQENLHGINTDDAFLPYRGYWCGWNIGNGSGSSSLQVRNSDWNNPLSVNGSATLNGISTAGIASATNTFYDASLRILREPGDQVRLTAILNGETNEAATTTLSADTFNFVMIQNTSGPNVHRLDLTNLLIETGFVTPPEPEPPVDLSTRPNVLFICVDDLRPQTAAYGEDYMITPNLDRLADEGRLFHNHYVQSPTCGSSRYAMLTGRRYSPTDGGNRNNDVLWDRRPSVQPTEAWSIPDMFRRAGYQTVGLGKISHSPDNYHYGQGQASYPASLVHEMPFSWSEILIPPSFISKWGNGWNAFFAYADGSTRTPGVSPPLEIGDPLAHAEPLYPDTDIADTAVQKLLSFGTNRFFMSVGFYKPHLPFNAPQEFFDLYDTNSLPFAPFTGTSVGIHSRSNTQSGEPVNNYGHAAEFSGWQNEANAFYQAQLRQGYFACVSYIDAQVGKLLDTLDATGLHTNTVVVLWGDHGWHLGDNNLWGKHTKFERAARSALIIRTPGMKFRGYQTRAIVESIDLFPTLAELAELTSPSHLDGESIVPVLNDPNHPGKDAAITYWNPASSVRTERYRLVHYHDNDFMELFDHAIDPQEQTNRVAEAVYSNTVAAIEAISTSNTAVRLDAPDHYRTWLTNFFTTAELADEGLVGPGANADSDPYVNLAEFARGSHPRGFDDGSDVQGVVTNGTFAAAFVRNRLATDVQTTLQASTDLTDWESIDPDDPAFRLERTFDGDREHLLIKGPDVNPLYLRLQISRP